MSITPVAPAARRVREQAKETAAVMAFSAAASVGMATAILLLTSLAR